MKKLDYSAKANNSTPSVTQYENASERDQAALPAFMRGKDDGARATTPADYQTEDGNANLPRWMRGEEHPLGGDHLDDVLNADGSRAGYSEAVKKHVGVSSSKDRSLSDEARNKRAKNIRDLKGGVVKTTDHRGKKMKIKPRTLAELKRNAQTKPLWKIGKNGAKKIKSPAPVAVVAGTPVPRG